MPATALAFAVVGSFEEAIARPDGAADTDVEHLGLELLGDAAHAIVPFFGQGANCGFEDLTELDRCFTEMGVNASNSTPGAGNHSDLEALFTELVKRRKNNCDAIADMAVENFTEMRDKVSDPRFLMGKAVEKVLAEERENVPLVLVTVLGLVTTFGFLAGFVVGGIGVALSIHAFVREKLPSIAILKTVGADTATIIYSYLGQAVGLGLLGSVVGIGIGVALQMVLPQAVSTLLATDVLQQVEFTSVLSLAALAPIGKGLGLGILTTLLFSLWPLLTIRDIKPAAIFRRDVEGAVHPRTVATGGRGRHRGSVGRHVRPLLQWETRARSRRARSGGRIARRTVRGTGLPPSCSPRR